MSQPAPPVFIDLKIAAAHAETPELCHVSLTGAPPEFLAAHTAPGQYVQIRAGGNKPGFFALASAPGRPQIELLIKRGSPIADAIISTPVGATLQVSPPAGRGYPMEQARGRSLFVIGVGSGIAPLRAVIQSVIDQRDAYGRVCLIYGARNSGGFPYCAEMASWKTRSIDVIQVCSQPAAGTWNGTVGRVQHALLAGHAQIDPASAAFVCGMKAMVEDVKAALMKLGLPADRVYQNY